ncbi:MAG TPA: carcinine hydrolase/isopenicillin-N N-acyltransferase family protein [Acidobacteriota bacterium]|nr:carcinine hydrolase/isopenicillin-N N-acyltransferase family protein [Acidobacteriota bacterium]
MLRTTTITLLTLFLFAGCSFACTMVMLAKGDVILAGNNEDWKDTNTRMWFVPATEKAYGRVCFGFDNGFTQGGMNDQGLFIDGNALAPTGWKADPDKTRFLFNPMDYILAHCATVDEAAEFFGKYNHPSLARAKFPIADAFGGSIVVEWDQGKLQIIRREGRYQISTNFVQTNFKPEDYPCSRYRTAEGIFKSTEDVSVDLVRSVLDATHQEGPYPTVYSNIYDLKNKVVYLYNFHNFDDPYVFDLAEELKKGRRSIKIASLFP